LSSESKCEASHGALFAPGLSLLDFLAGYPVLPIHRSILSRPHPLSASWLPIPPKRNVTNAPEIIVRMKRGKIVTHYKELQKALLVAIKKKIRWIFT
jgi:hypothetical protein